MRLIDADALVSALNNGRLKEQTGRAVPFNAGVAFALTMVEYAQTIDAVPVRHGHWQITDAYPHNVYCSECHKKCAQTHWAVWEDGSLPRRFCPNCGARMDGDSDEID